MYGTLGCHSSNYIEKQAAVTLPIRTAAVIVSAARQSVPGKLSPESAIWQPGSVTFHPLAVPVGPLRQSDRLVISGPISTETPDELRTSTDITNGQSDIDLTEVNVQYSSPLAPVTFSANATARTVTYCFYLSRLENIPTLIHYIQRHGPEYYRDNSFSPIPDNA